MRALVLSCAVLAGCADAVVIEVKPAPGVPTDRVQLFIGLRHCDDCPGIKPPTSSGTPAENGEVLPGAVYYREDSNLMLARREAAVEDGVARFRIEASEIGDRFELAVAADVNNRSAVLIPSLPLDKAGVYKVDLVAADPNLGPKPTAVSGNFVAVWNQPTAMTPCMGFERWDNGQLVGERVFIVPENDLDCDEIANECNPYGYKSMGVPPIEKSTCTRYAFLGNESICKLGGEACLDTTGQVEPCVPGEYCLPSAYCDRIGNLNCDFTAQDSVSLCLFKTPPLARLRCTAPFRPVGGQAYEPCGSVAFELPDAMLPVRCVGPSGPLMLGQSEQASLAFTDSYTYRTDANGQSLALAAKFRHEYECKYKLELDGQASEFNVLGRKLSQAAFVQIWLQRSGGLTRKLLVPLVIEPFDDATCSREGQCTLEVPQTDDLAQCVR